MHSQYIITILWIFNKCKQQLLLLLFPIRLFLSFSVGGGGDLFANLSKIVGTVMERSYKIYVT